MSTGTANGPVAYGAGAHCKGEAALCSKALRGYLKFPYPIPFRDQHPNAAESLERLTGPIPYGTRAQIGRMALHSWLLHRTTRNTAEEVTGNTTIGVKTMGYNDEILQIRQQRAARDIQEAQEVIKEKYAETVQARDQAAAQGDAEPSSITIERPNNLKTNGNKLPRHRRRKHPSFPSQARDLSTRGKPLTKGYGAAAMQAYRAAHEFAVQRGLKPDTQEYFKYCDDALDMYAKDYGLRYDPSEKVPHAERGLRDELA